MEFVEAVYDAKVKTTIGANLLPMLGTSELASFLIMFS
jgi:hypothetical protein